MAACVGGNVRKILLNPFAMFIIRNDVHALLFWLFGVRHRAWPGNYKTDTFFCKTRLSVKQVSLYNISEDRYDTYGGI